MAIDDEHRLLVLGPVPVAGSFKHEEVRAARRVMLAIAQIDPRFCGLQVIALTTRDSRKWGDNNVLQRMAYAGASKLTREGIGWLAQVTRGADLQVFHQLNEKCLAEAITERHSLSCGEERQKLEVTAQLTTTRRFFLKFWRG